MSPQIWAWRTGRVRQIKKYVRKNDRDLPFEQEFYRRHGVEASYVRHPLAYEAPPQISREEFAAQHGLDPKKQWITLLPGSRRKEVRLNLLPMLRATTLPQKQGDFEFVLPVASTLDPQWLAGQWTEYRLRPHSATAEAGSLSAIHLTHNAHATLMHARAAVVASSTATVEAALSGTPFVAVYRLAPLTWLVDRRLVKLDTFAIPNLIAGKKIVPDPERPHSTKRLEGAQCHHDGPARQQMEAA